MDISCFHFHKCKVLHSVTMVTHVLAYKCHTRWCKRLHTSCLAAMEVPGQAHACCISMWSDITITSYIYQEVVLRGFHAVSGPNTWTANNWQIGWLELQAGGVGEEGLGAQLEDESEGIQCMHSACTLIWLSLEPADQAYVSGGEIYISKLSGRLYVDGPGLKWQSEES